MAANQNRKSNKREFLSQDTVISSRDDELVVTRSATIYCTAAPRLEAHGKSKILGRKAVGLGRDKHNGVIIADPQVSKFHGIINFRKGGAYIRDTGSTNGTYVNGERIRPNKEVLLQHRDVLRLGTAKITILYR